MARIIAPTMLRRITIRLFLRPAISSFVSMTGMLPRTGRGRPHCQGVFFKHRIVGKLSYCRKPDSGAQRQHNTNKHDGQPVRAGRLFGYAGRVDEGEALSFLLAFKSGGNICRHGFALEFTEFILGNVPFKGKHAVLFFHPRRSFDAALVFFPLLFRIGNLFFRSF